MGEEKKIEYLNCVDLKNNTVLAKHLNQLADALRSNNNNNGAIKNFSFHEQNLNSVTWQPLWDALLEGGVRKVALGNFNNDSDNTNNPINFTGFRTNTLIKELRLGYYYMSQQNWKNLFDAIAVNKGLEKLELCDDKVLAKLDLILLFKQMMRMNTSLLDVSLCYRGTGNQCPDDLQIEIDIQIKLNRMWKRYILRRKLEYKKTSTAANAVTNNNNEEEEKRKKRLKMRLLLQFIEKPALRDTILFHLLSEYPDDLSIFNNN